MRSAVVIAAVICCAIGLRTAQADIIASTSFENESVFSGQYTDTGNAGVDHDLVNNSGEPVVDHTSTGLPDLGYDASYVNTRDSVGLTDGDFVGVTDYATDVGSYTDGTQGYQMSDCDGMMVLTFDSVDLTGHTNCSINLDLFVPDTSWETSPLDSILVQVELTGATAIDLLDTANGSPDNDIDNQGIEGTWLDLSASIPDGATSAQLIVQLDSNAGPEAIYIDDVNFEGTTVPEPGSFILLGLSGLVGAVIRRRRQRA